MLMMALLAAAPLAFAPDLPISVPNTDSWRVAVDTTVTRKITDDYLFTAVGMFGKSAEFVIRRNICAADDAGCEYVVHYELRQLEEDGRMLAFTVHYRISGPTGATAEGLSYMYYRGRHREFDYFFWTGQMWLREPPIRELIEPVRDYFEMLVTVFQRRESLLF